MQPDMRIDPTHGTKVHVVGSRQSRPVLATNVAAGSCPFCVGGLEAPEEYIVRWFPNRWPAMPDERCEVVLYSPDHHATWSSMTVAHIEKVIELWVERTDALAARGDVDCVFVFENRGAELGATIEHPHGQVYAFDHMPTRSRERLTWKPPSDSHLTVTNNDSWRCAVPAASAYPVALELWPTEQRQDLMSLTSQQRRGLADILHDVMSRLDRLYATPLPYMLWINPRDFSATTTHDHWLHIEIVSPWRGPNLMRYIAAAEVGTGEYFNPVTPESLAATLADRAE